MEDLTFGLLAIAAGALFRFRGWVAFRLVILLWGAFVGFALGAGVRRTLPKPAHSFGSMDKRSGGPTTSTRRRQLRTRPAIPATCMGH